MSFLGGFHEVNGVSTACGGEHLFKTEKQTRFWLKLHRKRCSICSNSKTHETYLSGNKFNERQYAINGSNPHVLFDKLHADKLSSNIIN